MLTWESICHSALQGTDRPQIRQRVSDMHSPAAHGELGHPSAAAAASPLTPYSAAGEISHCDPQSAGV